MTDSYNVNTDKIKVGFINLMKIGNGQSKILYARPNF